MGGSVIPPSRRAHGRRVLLSANSPAEKILPKRPDCWGLPKVGQGHGTGSSLALCIRLQGSISAVGEENKKINKMLQITSGKEVSAGSARAHIDGDAQREAVPLSPMPIETRTPTHELRQILTDTTWPPSSPAPRRVGQARKGDNGSEMRDRGVRPHPSMW